MVNVIARYTEDCAPAVREFNARLAADGAAEFQLPETPSERCDGRRLAEECFLALEGCAVRGGYILNHQDFSLRGKTIRAAHYRLGVSEGVVNRAYAGVGLQMLRAALNREPMLFALGMGGEERPLPRMLKAMGWRLESVPFYFKMVRPARVLGELRMLQSTPARRAAAAAARFTGAGWLAVHAAQTWKGRAAPAAAAEPVPAFEQWADALWERANAGYALVAARDAASLNALYPPGEARYIRLRVPQGWALVLDTRMRGHKQFGDLRVGTIADCLALPQDAEAVTAAAAGWLSARGVDLIVSNQSHAAWGRALERSGFLRGPSNYVFAASRKLAEALGGFEEMHINRGDGDGPIHL
ncbi:MAG: hypothetical protein ACM336_20515 [Acidobacteriota bacterium]